MMEEGADEKLQREVEEELKMAELERLMMQEEKEKQQEALAAQEIVAAPVVEAAPEPMETEDSVEAIAPAQPVEETGPAIADAAAPISPVAASPAVSPEAKVLTPPPLWKKAPPPLRRRRRRRAHAQLPRRREGN